MKKLIRSRSLKVWQIMPGLTAFVFLLAGSQAYAQFLRAVDTTKPPLRPMYGVGQDEFYIAATFQKWGPIQQANLERYYQDLWNHASWMGIPILNVQMSAVDTSQNQAFLYSSNRQSNQRVLLTLKPLNDMGWGQSIEFYAFDSVQSQLWPTKFLHRQGGVLDTNKNTKEWIGGTHPVLEQLYTSSNTGANDSILWGIVYGYDPVLQQYRWVEPWMNRAFYSNDSVQKTNAFLKDRRHTTGPDSMNYLVLTGHLRDLVNQNSAVADTTPLLRIDIVYEIPKYNDADTNNNRVSYYNASGQQLIAQQNMEFVCRSYYLQKQDLMDASLGWNEYKEAVFAMPLNWCSDELTRGPMYPSTTSKSIDVRVHWLGVNEDVYLRSVSLRDYRGQMAVGRTPEAKAYRRDNIMKVLKPIMYGAGVNLNNGVGYGKQ